ncbi:MAG: serine hydrolase [Clostridia bacterium]|nr:serine hydrolase [Deltaproteobacteria bacterium]
MKSQEKKELPSVQVPEIDRCIQTFIAEKHCSAAACIASVGGRVFHRAVYGCAVAPPPVRKIGLDTVFDLSTLTQPLATGLVAMELASRGRIDLGASLATTIPEMRDTKFAAMTIDMLLDHTSGLPTSRKFWEDIANEEARLRPELKTMGTKKSGPKLRKLLADVRLEADPGTKVVVSDLGFMILGWVLENIAQQPLDVFLQKEIYRGLGLDKDLFFVRHDEPPAKVGPRRVFAATEKSEWRDKLLQGEVQDPNAWTLGGVAGHAGLFGTVDGVWRLTEAMWESYSGNGRQFLSGPVRRFWTRSKRIRGNTRALAWDTPTAHNASAGKRYSLNSIGAVSIGGCSIWVDLATDMIGVLLTNAAHPTLDGKEEPLAKFRPRLYELIAKHGEAMPPDPAKATGSAAFYTIPGSGGGGVHNPMTTLRKPGK